jgi:hypothetical protein
MYRAARCEGLVYGGRNFLCASCDDNDDDDEVGDAAVVVIVMVIEGDVMLEVA